MKKSVVASLIMLFALFVLPLLFVSRVVNVADGPGTPRLPGQPPSHLQTARIVADGPGTPRLPIAMDGPGTPRLPGTKG